VAIEPERLVSESASERIDLEFKLALPGRADSDRFEVLKDVSAFANSGGGTIYYGVEEQNGVAASIRPITSETFDEAARRLGQIVEAGVEPRVQGIRYIEFRTEGGYVLAVVVPARFSTPCRAVQNGRYKFFKRSQNFVSEMTYDEIRNAFDRAGSSSQAAEAAWDARLNQVRGRQTWKPLVHGPVSIARLTPLSIAQGSQQIDLQKVYDEYTTLSHPDWHGISRAYNLDGIVAYGPLADRGEAAKMTQVYRNGTIDSVRNCGTPWQETRVIPAAVVATFFRLSFLKLSAFVRAHEVPGPFLFQAAMLDVGGSIFGLDSRGLSFEDYTADRNDFIIPSFYIDYDSLGDESIVKNILDMIWQGFGLTNCRYYDDDGNWTVV
jgi:hypothetical protein